MVVGLVVGGGGVWVALEKPWASSKQAKPSVDAGVPVAKNTKNKRKRRWRGKRKTRYKISGKPIVLTAAQQAMVWRGSVRKPAQSADFSSEGGGRTLSGSEINRVIGGQSGGFVGCMQKARGNASLSATITLKMLVNGQGRPTQVALHAPRYLFDKGFAGCARAAARGMKFAATGRYTVVTAPYTIN